MMKFLAKIGGLRKDDWLVGEEIGAYVLAVGEGLLRARVVQEIMQSLPGSVDAALFNEMESEWI